MVVKERLCRTDPRSEVMIFDEAHQLPDIASQYLASRSPAASYWIDKDITIAYRTELKDTQQLQNADRLAQSAQDFRLVGRPHIAATCATGLWRIYIQRALLLLDDALELCYDATNSLGRSALLDAAFERATLVAA